MTRKLLTLLVILLVGCVPSLDDATPSQEVWLTDTPVIIPTVRAEPPPFIVHRFTGALPTAPERIAGGYSFDFHGFVGTVGVTGEWQETNSYTCYLTRGEAEVNLADARCSYTPTAFNFIPIMHYADGTEHSENPLTLRSGALDSVNGYYKLEVPLLLSSDEPSFLEWAWNARVNCANFGNTVEITNVSLEAVSPDYCAVLGG